MLGGSGGSIKLASIEITTPPTKTAYKAGDQFSTAGMVVKATYSNGATLIATGVSVEPSGGLEAGRTSVTIRYTEGGVSCTATQAITVTKTNVTVPSQSGSLTYSGGSQSPAWYNYDTTKMTLGGTTSGTNAGNYSAKFTLKDTALYQWADGSTAPKTVSWKIGKADGSLTLSKTSIKLEVGNRRRSGNRLGIYVFYCHTITPYNSVTSACGMIAAFFRSSVMALISRMTRFVKERSAVTMPMCDSSRRQ